MDAGADTSTPDAGGGEHAFTVSNGFVRDRDGRAVLLRGVNIAHTAKRSPDGVPWVDAEAVKRLRTEFGFNVIRLTLFWRWVEPERGTYDAGYLAHMRDILDWAEAANILVVLDMHQDLFGFEADDHDEGDGVPLWAHSADCPPFQNLSPWFNNYFTDALNCQFSAFWANENGVQEAFADMWRHVTSELGAHPAVVGVDLFNEPWIPGSYGTPADGLVPFYERVIPAVREAAPGVPVFFEPGTLSGSVSDQSIPTPAFDGLVYAPHYYPTAVFGLVAGQTYTPMPDALAALDTQQAADVRAEIPRWIGEFGVTDGVIGADVYLRDLLELWRGQFVGFALWSYDSTSAYDIAMLDAEGNALPQVVELVEPFAERMPGTPTSTSLDREAGTLELALASDGGELLVSCPARLCATKHEVTLKGESTGSVSALSYDPELGLLRATLPAGALTVQVSFTGP